MSWSYPAKGNLITAHQYYQDLKASKDQEAIDGGEQCPAGKRNDGNPTGECQGRRPIKCRYVIYILRSVKGQIIDALRLGLRTRLEHQTV